MAQYVVYVEEDPEGGFIATCPSLPGCTTQGDTKDEAVTMIKDAIHGYLESLKKHGEAIPHGEVHIVDVAA